MVSVPWDINPKTPDPGIHHPNFGRHLVNKMDELGIENVFVYTPESKRHNISRELVEFF